MKRLLFAAALAAALATAAPAAMAQAWGSGPGMHGGPFTRFGPPASGPFPGGGYGMHSGSPYGATSWLLTREEFRTHLERMLALQTYEECQAYMAEHHAALQERARARGEVWYSGGGYFPVCEYFRN
jgi:hypothetical protein